MALVFLLMILHMIRPSLHISSIPPPASLTSFQQSHASDVVLGHSRLSTMGPREWRKHGLGGLDGVYHTFSRGNRLRL